MRGKTVEVRVAGHTQVAVPLTWPETREGPASIAAARPARKRVLVAGVGYQNLRDMSVGPIMAERLSALDWPEGVQVEDLSFGAVHVLHWFQQSESFDAAVFVTAAARGREPGSVHRFAWSAPDVPAEEVQAGVAEAVTGVISLDTLLTVVGYFGALPPRVLVVEVEPRDDSWGPELSPPVEAALDEVADVVREEVLELAA